VKTSGPQFKDLWEEEPGHLYLLHIGFLFLNIKPKIVEEKNTRSERQTGHGTMLLCHHNPTRRSIKEKQKSSISKELERINNIIITSPINVK